ncbi:hypothetical protein ACHAXR_001102 [Thalassiosira sp. AJA248-18]
MTMSPSNNTVRWLCSSLVSMCPEALDVVEAIMPDMGETFYFTILTIHLFINHSVMLFSNRCQGRTCVEYVAQRCLLCWRLYAAYDDSRLCSLFLYPAGGCWRRIRPDRRLLWGSDT